MWVAPKKRPLYGNIFPDVRLLGPNRTRSDEVFGCRLRSSGMGTQSVEYFLDAQKWQHCNECPHYWPCCRLSAATLMLSATVRA